MLYGMSTAVSDTRSRPRRTLKYRTQREGITLLAGIIALMWVVEIINAADSYNLDRDGIYSRNLGRLWGIFTAPFIHANFVPHLLDNTIPLVFLGLSSPCVAPGALRASPRSSSSWADWGLG